MSVNVGGKASKMTSKTSRKTSKNSKLDLIASWFKNSETIFLARAEVVVGFLVTAISAMDWSPLLAVGADTGFTWKQGCTIGSMLIVKGIISEWARRRNDPYLGK